MSETRVVGLEFRLDEFVAVEIDERNLAVFELIGEAGCVQKKICVAMMTGSLRNDYRCGTEPEKSLGRRADNLRIGVHCWCR